MLSDLSIELSFNHQQNILHKTFFANNILQQSCVICNILKSRFFLLAKHVEDPRGPFDRQCSPSPTSDQNFNMADNEENKSGEMRDLPLVGE